MYYSCLTLRFSYYFQLQAWYAELKDQQFRLAGALRRMMNRKLSMAWETWQQWYADLLHQRFILNGAIHRMLKRKLSMAWEKWQFWYAEFMQQKFLMAGAVKRLMERMLSKAWEQWQWQYAELMRQKMLIKRGLMRLMQRKMAAAFGKWRLVTDYLLRLFEKMGRRWRNRSIFAAFNKWRSMLVPPAPPGTPKPVCFSFPDLPAPLPAPRSNQFLGLEAEGCLVSQYFPATSRHHHNTVNAYATTIDKTRSYPDSSLSLGGKAPSNMFAVDGTHHY